MRCTVIVFAGWLGAVLLYTPAPSEELMNQWGRRERNSFVDIIEPGPRRVWVRWTHFGVNMTAGQPAYRAVEDFWAYPNGLVLRRQTTGRLFPESTKAMPASRSS